MNSARFRLLHLGALVVAASWIPMTVFADSGAFKTAAIHPRIEQLTFRSRVLSQPMSLCIVFPEAVTETDRPVLFWLHGRGRTCRSLVDDPIASPELLKTKIVLVFPQGDDGWYIDSPLIPADRYSSWLEEAMEVATARYRLSSNPKRRGVCGWSMGGYGAVRFAAAHPGEFGTVCSIIGLLDFPQTGFPEGQRYDVPTKRFGTDPTVWQKFNPLHQSSGLKGSQILLIAADQAFDRTMNENFHESLLRQKIDHDWVQLQGRHTFDVVRASVPIVIDFANRTLGNHSE